MSETKSALPRRESVKRILQLSLFRFWFCCKSFVAGRVSFGRGRLFE